MNPIYRNQAVYFFHMICHKISPLIRWLISELQGSLYHPSFVWQLGTAKNDRVGPNLQRKLWEMKVMMNVSYIKM